MLELSNGRKRLDICEYCWPGVLFSNGDFPGVACNLTPPIRSKRLRRGPVGQLP
jgi:hypothetical protein